MPRKNWADACKSLESERSVILTVEFIKTRVVRYSAAKTWMFLCRNTRSTMGRSPMRSVSRLLGRSVMASATEPNLLGAAAGVWSMSIFTINGFALPPGLVLMRKSGNLPSKKVAIGSLLCISALVRYVSPCLSSSFCKTWQMYV